MTTSAAKKLPIEASDNLPDGRVIADRYEVLRTLKLGQDTETLLATDQSQGTAVIIKTAAAALFSATARMRLEHEAQVLLQLKSGLIPLLDHGTTDGQVYLVTPFLPGITLQALLRKGPLGVMDTITVAHAILTALGTAHAQGVL